MPRSPPPGRQLATQGEHLLQQADYLTIWMHHWIGLALARAGQWDKAQQQLAFLTTASRGASQRLLVHARRRFTRRRDGTHA